MTTWASLLSDIRVDLKDTAATKRWPDETLYVYLKDAIRDYSLYFPLRVSRATLLLDGVSYPLPADYLGGPTVECPLNHYLEERMERPGVRYSAAGRPTTFYTAGGRLFLDSAPQDGDQVFLSYDARHPIPESPADADFLLTVPEMDEELLRIYIKAKANGQVRGQQSNLDRFKLGSGNRDDNPLEPEVGNLMEEYHLKIAARFPGGVVKLWRPGLPR